MLHIFLIPYDPASPLYGSYELGAHARQLCFGLLDEVQAYWRKAHMAGHERIRVLVSDDVLGQHVGQMITQRIAQWNIPVDAVALCWPMHEQGALTWAHMLRTLDASREVLCVCLADVNRMSNLYNFFVERQTLPGLIWKPSEGLRIHWDKGRAVSAYEFFMVIDAMQPKNS